MVTKSSYGSVAETVARLTGILAARGIKVFALIDHAAEAAAAGLELRPTVVVVFGNPVAGTPVMAAAPLVALDLPLKVLVWDDAGTTRLTYVAPTELAARYDLADDLAGRLASIDALTEAALA